MQLALTVNDSETTRSEIVGMISFVRKKFVPNVMKVVDCVHEEVVVHASCQLGWCRIVAGVETEPDSTSYRCFKTLLIGRAGETQPCR